MDAWRASTVLSRVVTVRNYSAGSITYAIKPTFRYSDDRLLGAIKFTAPLTITIPARSARSFTVKMTINGAKLRAWTLDSGANALAARILDTLEFDGYLNLDNTGHLDGQRRSAAPRLARPATAVGQRLVAAERRHRHDHPGRLARGPAGG